MSPWLLVYIGNHLSDIRLEPVLVVLEILKQCNLDYNYNSAGISRLRKGFHLPFAKGGGYFLRAFPRL